MGDRPQKQGQIQDQSQPIASCAGGLGTTGLRTAVLPTATGTRLTTVTTTLASAQSVAEALDEIASVFWALAAYLQALAKICQTILTMAHRAGPLCW